MEGVVKSFDPNTGYGFIILENDNEVQEVFFHKKNIYGNPLEFHRGVRVLFNIIDTPKGKNAINVILKYAREDMKYIRKILNGSNKNTG
ncbi:MAG: cold-shock protein [Promethearchaeota archaeon]